MRIEQRLAESIRSFHLDALSSAVALNVDLDTTLTVWAAAAYDALRRQLPATKARPRHDLATLHQHQRTDHHRPRDITARLSSRTYSPVMRTANLPKTEIPWWNGRHLPSSSPDRRPPSQAGVDSLFGNPS